MINAKKIKQPTEGDQCLNCAKKASILMEINGVQETLCLKCAEKLCQKLAIAVGAQAKKSK